MKDIKREFEEAMSELLRELRRTHPCLLTAIIDGVMEQQGCSEDEAIRWLAEFETTVKQMLDASRSIK